MYNEGKSIAQCLDALVGQDYPADRLELLIVDGMSTDDSTTIVRSYMTRHSNLRLLQNPRRITPVAFNLGIRAARGDFIGIVSAHSILASDYVTQCVHYLESTGAEHVGGLMTAVGLSRAAKAIAESTNSPFGVGGSRFHYDQREQYVESVYMGVYRREVFDWVGLFDEELVRNQDDEFNYRLHKAGGRHFQTPSIHSIYYSRATYKSLWHQYLQYGFWKPRVFQKVPGSMRWRHLIPSLFLLVLVGGAVVSPFSVAARIVWLVVVGLYVIVMSIGAGRAARKLGGWAFPLSLAAFPTMHLAYGVGFLGGLVYSSLIGGSE
jgi:GT2 family glycosyltransferase